MPLSAAAAGLVARNTVGVETLFAGGDDYEVLCTTSEALIYIVMSRLMLRRLARRL